MSEDPINTNKVYIITKKDGSVTRTRYYRDGSIDNIMYLDSDGLLHRDNAPTYIAYHEDGSLQCEFYYLHGNSHRVDGPARIWYSYHEGKQNMIVEYYLLNIKVRQKQFETPGFIDAFIMEHS